MLLLNLFWLTRPENAAPLISYMVAQLSEIDLLLDARYAEMVRYAQANPEGSLELPEFPVNLTLRCADVATMSKSELRAQILQEASETIYLQGWAAHGELEADSSRSLRWSISTANLLGQQGHRLLQILLLLSALCSVLLAIAFAHRIRGFRKLPGLGACFCIASIISLLVLVAGASAARTISARQDDPFLENLMELAQTLSQIMQRSYIVFLALVLAFIALGFIADRLVRRLREPE